MITPITVEDTNPTDNYYDLELAHASAKEAETRIRYGVARKSVVNADRYTRNERSLVFELSIAVDELDRASRALRDIIKDLQSKPRGR